MKERPILFSGPMVRAILEGRKTQTRRVIKPQPAYHPVFANELHWRGSDINPDSTYRSPYGVPGDRLWVRETWMACDKRGFPVMEHPTRENTAEVLYRASHVGDGWRPSIFMPRWASRLLLEITAVRIERLQDIGEADALAEGFPGLEETGGAMSARYVLHVEWDKLNAKRGSPWADNPWVWVLTFEVVK
jgi:hypothetical protein